MRMLKTVIALAGVLAVGSLGLSAAPLNAKKVVLPPDLPKTFTLQEQAWIKSALSEEYLKQRIAAIGDDFLRKKDFPPPQMQFHIKELQSFDHYYFLESDSGLSRRWVRQNIAFAEALLKTKGQMSLLILNKKTGTEEYRKLYTYYTQTAQTYWALCRKPVKVTDKKKIDQLARVKRAVLEQLKKKDTKGQ